MEFQVRERRYQRQRTHLPVVTLSFSGTWTACLELAVFAFVYVPVWAAVAHVAVPQNEARVALDHHELVSAGIGDRHRYLPSGIKQLRDR